MTTNPETESEKFDEKKSAFDFLHSEYRFYLDRIWKTFENGWEIYKFYLTVISGLSAVFLGIVTLSKDTYLLVLIGSLFSLLMFVLGICILVQLIYENIDLSRSYAKLVIIRKKLSSITVLQEYFNLELTVDKDWVISHTKYSMKHLIYRSINGAGVKTQVIIINSAVGTIGLYLAFFIGENIPSIKVIPLVVLCFILLLGFHGVISNLKWRYNPK